MAEVKTANGQVVGGLPQARPGEGKIRAQNAQRVGRRRQAAALALDVQRTSGDNLSREGEQRKVGGRFEKLQKVPKRKAPSRQGLQLADLGAILQALSFEGKDKVLGRKSFLTSFGPGVLGLNQTNGSD
jgi:hypothetical protein